jgi:L-lactate utilization protein LutC
MLRGGLDAERALLNLWMWHVAHESQKRLKKFVKQLRKRLKRAPRSEWDAVVSELVEEYQSKYGYTEEALLYIARAVAGALEKGES